MSSKNKIIIFGVILLILISSTIIYFLIPKIEIVLNGNSKITLELGNKYNELGATAYVNKIFNKKKLNVEIIGNVNINKIGKYEIKYRVFDNNNVKEIERIVTVIDTVKPIITLNSEIKACKNNKIVEIDATAKDNYDGDITNKLNYRVENDNVFLTVSDSSNNKMEISEKIKYIDNEIPVINLINDETIYILLGEEYQEYGASANDSCDGNLTDKITIENNVNTNKIGTYEVKYSVKDNEQNEVKVIRKVIVVDEKNKIVEKVKNGIIYLTFDDGPGVYTSEFLNVLAKYDVKATFFVTNQFPKYQYLIKQEYDQGHTIGIHTYSHKWSIYESVEAYSEDFKKIDNIIYDQIGIHTNFFRFPGGSSNTVSRNYNKGIMTKLSQIMTERGYIYFDWTFDSGDTSKNKNSKNDIINTVKKYLKGDGNYIILMHDLKKSTLEALPEIIEYAKERGYVFEPITENTPIAHFKIAN